MAVVVVTLHAFMGYNSYKFCRLLGMLVTLNAHSMYDHVVTVHVSVLISVVLHALHLHLNLKARGVMPLECCHIALHSAAFDLRVCLCLALLGL